MSSNRLYDALVNGNPQYNRLIKLDTPLGTDCLLPLQVKGTSRLGRDYEFVVDVVTTRREIELQSLIAQPVTLWIQQTDGTYLPHHGYVHAFSRLGSDGYLTYFQLRFSSWLYFLRLRRDMRDWQEQSEEQILADVYHQHPQANFRFELRRTRPQSSYCVQADSDWNFTHRRMEPAGMFGRFEQAQDGKSHTWVVMDDAFFVPPLGQQTVRFSRAGLDDEADGLTQWVEKGQLDSAQLTTRTFDYKRSDLNKEIVTSREDVPAQNRLPADGEIYDYTGAYSWGQSKDGEFFARIRMEEWESRSRRFHGVGGLRNAMPGRWFELQGHPIHDEGQQTDREFLIVAVDWIIRNNLPGANGSVDFPESLNVELEQARAAHGQQGGEIVSHPDGSEGFYRIELEAQLRRVPFRSPFEHRKPRMRLQNAIVAGPDKEEVYTDELNRVKVWFPWNRRNSGDERASCWVRAAFPDAGGTRGGTFPLRKGDEILVGWLEGDCDRPVILSRMHGGDTAPIWNTHGLLSGHRSKEYGGSGYNQIVMDDSTGQNRVHLYTTTAQSHLHLGYLIQHTDNTRGAYLGTGFDLKSDAYGALRAAQGLYVTTHAASAGQPMSAGPASEQLVNAESVMDAMSQASATSKAETLQAGEDALKKFTDATQHSVAGSESNGGRTAGGGTGNANGFADPIMLMASPDGIGLSTQQSTHVIANEQVNVVSGQSTHVVTGKSLLASMGQMMSLFVQNAGMKLFAGKGQVEIQAQNDAMALTALKDLTITSSDGKITLAASKEIWIGAGGSYIKINGSQIENGTSGQILERGASWSKESAANMNYPLPSPRPDQAGQLELLHRYANKEAVKHGAFSVYDAGGALLKTGALDGAGHMIVSGLPAGVKKVVFGDDPREQDHDPSRFEVAEWPAKADEGKGAGASQTQSELGGLMPDSDGPGGAAGLGKVAGVGSVPGSASLANTMGGTAVNGIGKNAGALMGLAAQATQGTGALAKAAEGQALGLAQQALTKALPTGMQPALSQASQLGAAAQQMSGAVQMARNAMPMAKSL
ncbi:type VI secretion system Vgr family protein [Trinickia fusca]|uniref:Type VI secretion system tip protein VgrG n=1 Tax=Trinickia fusca TaxID=2419777 RepID=A0A494WZG9_9BURK|nr:type VI secretion system Vgr family protein [Trinickia fusca]RKP43442.1 type VI secretion system tip protein VgrG [Trinickia fusca]